MSSHDTALSIADRMAPQLRRARLRILIVGGGVAGLTLAALLEARGEHPLVVEKSGAPAEGGYMLGMLPLGGRVLHGLGLHDAYLAESCPMRRYDFHDRNGTRLKSYPLDRITARFGAYRGISRARLLDLLGRAVEPASVLTGCTVRALEEGPEGVVVRFDDGSQQGFDLVVGADGMHSQIRRMVFGDEAAQRHETGWGGWVFWAPSLSADDDTYRELWSAGWGIGLYPVRDGLGLFLAGRLDRLEATDPASYAAEIRSRLPEGPFRTALDSNTPDRDAYLWRMEDRRARQWHSDRVVLLGDAAAGFLPTAGVGASMAMDSAAALADELSRAESARLGYALSLYESRQRHRVETAQKNSRDLARFMFVDRRPACWLRDGAMRFYTLDRLVAGISGVMTGA